MANWFYIAGSLCFLIGTVINMAHASRIIAKPYAAASVGDIETEHFHYDAATRTLTEK